MTTPTPTPNRNAIEESLTTLIHEAIAATNAGFYLDHEDQEAITDSVTATILNLVSLNPSTPSGAFPLVGPNGERGGALCLSLELKRWIDE